MGRMKAGPRQRLHRQLVKGGWRAVARHLALYQDAVDIPPLYLSDVPCKFSFLRSDHDTGTDMLYCERQIGSGCEIIATETEVFLLAPPKPKRKRAPVVPRSPDDTEARKGRRVEVWLPLDLKHRVAAYATGHNLTQSAAVGRVLSLYFGDAP